MEYELYQVVEFFEYLDNLRASGETNMFGAGAYLEAEFSLGRRKAGPILTAWMKTFDGSSSAEDRAAKSGLAA
jgi:hypothetical protein